MKKQQVKSLSLKKNVISSLSKDRIQGGTGQSVNQTCTGDASCGNCSAIGGGCGASLIGCGDPDFTRNEGSQCRCI